MAESAPLTFNHLYAFLDGEIFQHAATVYQTFFLEPDERVENHVCIKTCAIQDVEMNRWGKATLALRYGVNHSGFREGDSVLLNRPGARGEEILTSGFEMDWVEHDPVGRTITLSQSYGNNGRLPFGSGQSVVVDQSLAGHLRVVREAMDEIRSVPDDFGFFQNLMAGRLEQRPVQPHAELYAAICDALRLTESQREGFRLAVGTFPVCGIQGPPGTGKTYVLAAIAAYYVCMGHNVLVSALSHYAINNALNQAAKTMGLLKVPATAVKVSRNKNEGLELEAGLPLEISFGIRNGLKPGNNVYGMTSFKAAHDLRGAKLDVLILDEASQLPLPHAFMMMRHGNKTVLIGDHRQMRPIIGYRHHRHPDLYLSIFEFFRQLYPDRVRMLTDTFRMNDAVTAFPSRAFYDGRLTPFGETGARRLAIHPRPPAGEFKYWEILDPDRPSVFVELGHRFATKNCPAEAELVADLVLTAVRDYGVPARNIAVLVPFRAQQELIRARLRRLAREHRKRLELVLVDTVERMQGQERDMIIYSLTASDPDRLGAIADFFFDLHRFNVAITRARVKRIVVGSRHLLSARADDPDVLRHLNTLARFFRSEPTVRWEPPPSAAADGA